MAQDFCILHKYVPPLGTKEEVDKLNLKSETDKQRILFPAVTEEIYEFKLNTEAILDIS